VIRFVILVLSGSSVIHRAMLLYATLSIAIIPGVPAHHSGDTQNIAGKIAVIAKWWAMWAGIPRDRCRKKLKLPRTLLALVAAIAAWYLNVSDSSMNTPRYLICLLGGMEVLRIRRGECDARFRFLSLLVSGRP